MSQPEHRSIAAISADIALLSAELQAAIAHSQSIQSRRDKRKWRNKRHRMRQRQKRLNETKIEGKSNSKRLGSSHEYHGITWQDVPGKDSENKKLNFAMLRRGKSWKDISHLHGDELKAALATISSRQKVNGDQGGGRLKMKSLNSTNNQL